MVIDRIKVRPGLRQRLAESFETALKLTDGLAGIAFFDPKKRGRTDFFARFACPECGYNLEELEPRLFSFNNPLGACPECDGLGVKQYFDPNKIVHNTELSFSKRRYSRMGPAALILLPIVASVSASLSFRRGNTLHALACKATKEMILKGSGEEKIIFDCLSPLKK